MNDSLRIEQRGPIWLGEFRAMASPCEVHLELRSKKLARQLMVLAQKETLRIERLFSRYRDDNVIHRGVLPDDYPFAQRPGREHRAVLGNEVPPENRIKRVGPVVEWNIGDKTEPSLVDANQRHAEANQLPRQSEHGAVTANHDGQVGVLTDFRGPDRRMFTRRQYPGSFCLNQDCMPAACQEGGDVLYAAGDLVGLVAAHQGYAAESFGTHAFD